MNKDVIFNPDISSVKESENYKREEAAKKENESARQRFVNFFTNGRTRFALGIIFLLFGIYLLIAFLSFIFGAGAQDQNRELYYSAMENARNPEQIHNAVGALGAKVSQFFIADGFGFAAFIIVLWAVTIGIRLLKKDRKVYFYTYSLVCLFSLFAFSLVIGACTYNWSPTFYRLGGNFGYYANQNLLGLMGVYGMIAVNVVVALLWVLVCYKSLRAIYENVKSKIPTRTFSGEKVENDMGDNANQQSDFLGDERNARPAVVKKEEPLPADKPKVDRKPVIKKRPVAAAATTEAAVMNDIDAAKNITNPKDPTGEYMHYRFPPLSLLEDIKMNKNSVDVEEQETNKQRITETLNNYGIQIKKIDVHVGPTVTLFEIIPADGVRISKIRGLEDDIALSLSAIGIRIIAPMPGRGTIGIEIPNRDPQVVPMRRVLESEAYQNSHYELPMVLGCTVSNEVFVTDLAKVPHLLVAGATGKGKSVGLNTIITSLLYKKGPSELKFILIDPKRVEFSVFSDLEKYFFAKAPGEDRAIVTDTSRVVHTLNCLVQEMENRYKVFEGLKERKVTDYNKRWREQLRHELDEDGNKKYQYMPYIVCVIDEFSDMIMTAGKEVETPIVRLAQKGRAAGIHIIIATQRPSSQVITSLIKSNVPGRIAFAVAQMQDSRVIIDRSGAQRLIGRGDMLYMVDGDITRLQCPFVDTPEVVKICDFIKKQEDSDLNVNHEFCYELPEYVVPNDDGGVGGDFSGEGGNLNDRDPLFEEAAKWIVQSGDTASTSSLQRRYQIGYNRAGRIMDQMEAAGIVGPSQGGKPRKVLLTPMDVEQLFM